MSMEKTDEIVLKILDAGAELAITVEDCCKN